MKISRIDTFQLKAPIGDGVFWSSQARFGARKALLVRLETACGLVGWGEAGQYGPSEATAAALHSAFARLLLGADPREPEVLWERMYTSIRDYGRGGPYIEALSGVDIALWDLLGNHYKAPVHRLLGGAFRSAITAYATGLYYCGEEPRLETELPAVAEECARYVEAGLTAVKMKVGLLRPEEDYERVAAARRAIGGRTLLVDANHAYAPHVAARFARELGKHDVFWFEEPVLPESLAGYLQVKASSPVAIAGGECEHTRFGFAPWFAARAFDIAQPDLCCAGGLTELKRIAAMASAAQISCFPHVWGTGVAIAAGVQFLAALAPAPMTARPSAPASEPMLEWDSTPNPLRMAVLEQPLTLEAGKIAVPEGPGLGVRVNPEGFAPWLAAHQTSTA